MQALDALLHPMASTVPGLRMWGVRIGSVSMVLSFDPAAPPTGPWVASIGSPGAPTRFLGRYPDRASAVAAMTRMMTR